MSVEGRGRLALSPTEPMTNKAHRGPVAMRPRCYPYALRRSDGQRHARPSLDASRGRGRVPVRAIRTITISILAIGLLAGSAVLVAAQDEESPEPLVSPSPLPLDVEPMPSPAPVARFLPREIAGEQLVVGNLSPQEIVEQMLAWPIRTKVWLMAPLVRGRKGEHEQVFEGIRKQLGSI